MTCTRAETVDPMPAATVVLVRDRENGLQVLLLRRSAQSRFMGDNYVFPGGRVETADKKLDRWQSRVDLGPDEISRRIGGGITVGQGVAAAIAAIRETFEEAGVLLVRRRTVSGSALKKVSNQRLAGKLPPGWLHNLVPQDSRIIELSRLFRWSRWITPEQMPYRFDALFFVARMPADQICTPDMRETMHAMWIRPQEALRTNLSGEIALSPPTLVTLHEMLPHGCFQRLKKAAQKRLRDGPLLPRLITDGNEKMILEPWDPEYRRPRIRIDVASLRAGVASVGAPFSRLWFSEGNWIPVIY